MGIPARLVLATGNAGKLREMREILAPWQVDVRSLAEFTAGAAEETGLTFVENGSHLSPEQRAPLSSHAPEPPDTEADVLESENVLLECRFSVGLTNREFTLYWIRSNRHGTDNVAIGDLRLENNYA